MIVAGRVQIGSRRRVAALRTVERRAGRWVRRLRGEGCIIVAMATTNAQPTKEISEGVFMPLLGFGAGGANMALGRAGAEWALGLKECLVLALDARFRHIDDRRWALTDLRRECCHVSQ